MTDRPETEGEREALAAARAGRTQALGALLERYRPRLARMVACRLDARLRGRVDADDVLQEAFAEAYTRLDEYREERATFFLWVRLITAQRLMQAHRTHLGVHARDARAEVPLFRRGTPNASSVVLTSALLDRGASPSRMVVAAEQRERLRQALDGMKEMDREILMLRHFEHLTNREAAELLELTPPGASLRYVRALARLREITDGLGLSLGSLGET